MNATSDFSDGNSCHTRFGGMGMACHGQRGYKNMGFGKMLKALNLDL
jgi:hypothetical protein